MLKALLVGGISKISSVELFFQKINLLNCSVFFCSSACKSEFNKLKGTKRLVLILIILRMAVDE